MLGIIFEFKFTVFTFLKTLFTHRPWSSVSSNSDMNVNNNWCKGIDHIGMTFYIVSAIVHWFPTEPGEYEIKMNVDTFYLQFIHLFKV